MPRASAGVIVLVSGAVIAALYGCVCHMRAERVARAAVERVRATRPAVWHRLDWIVRLANPAIKTNVLRPQHGVGGPHFGRHLDVVERLERQEFIACATAVLCLALVIIGTKLWGWATGPIRRRLLSGR